MSSSLPSEAGERGAWSPRRWSLRSRLLVGQVLLLAAVCVGISTATEIALQNFLVDKLDSELADIVGRSVSFREPGRPPPPAGDRAPAWAVGPGPDFLGAPGQPIGTVAVTVDDGTVASAGMLNASAARVAVSDPAIAQVAALPADGKPVTRSITGLGRYRLIAEHDHNGTTVVIGMPLSEVDATLLRVLLVFVVVTGIALAAAATIGALIVRRALAPLDRVAATATRVAALKLDHGEVVLPVRVSADDADPGTEVGQLGAALNRMLAHIAGALSARQASETRVRQFLADASHELRTPLTAIRGYAELAQRKQSEVPAEVAHAMSRVESEAARMTNLVEDMLLLARLDSGRSLAREQVDLSRLTVDAVSDAHVAGPEHRWNLDLPAEPVVVQGDPARLYQVLTNLLANARIHTWPGTSVTISLTHQPACFAIWRVVDDGPGIPAQWQPEIFERFARGDSSRSRRAGSTGLGLAIVAAVVEAHGGTITVHSTPGSTEFTVRLPLSGPAVPGGG